MAKQIVTVTVILEIESDEAVCMEDVSNHVEVHTYPHKPSQAGFKVLRSWVDSLAGWTGLVYDEHFPPRPR